MTALVPMEDAQASFQVLRLSATSRLSWAALAAEEDLQRRGIGTLLVKTGVGGGGGGAGVLDSENNGIIRWQPSLIRRLS